MTRVVLGRVGPPRRSTPSSRRFRSRRGTRAALPRAAIRGRSVDRRGWVPPAPPAKTTTSPKPIAAKSPVIQTARITLAEQNLRAFPLGRHRRVGVVVGGHCGHVLAFTPSA